MQYDDLILSSLLIIIISNRIKCLEHDDDRDSEKKRGGKHTI